MRASSGRGGSLWGDSQLRQWTITLDLSGVLANGSIIQKENKPYLWCRLCPPVRQPNGAPVGYKEQGIMKAIALKAQMLLHGGLYYATLPESCGAG